MKHIDKLVYLVREHFEKNQKARELLEKVKSFKVSR